MSALFLDLKTNVRLHDRFDRGEMGYSPDRVDALVWALTELHDRGRRAPSVDGVSPAGL